MTPRALEIDLLLLHDVNYSSTIQVSLPMFQIKRVELCLLTGFQLQNIELRFWESVFEEKERHCRTAWIELAVSHFQRLVAHSLIREAAEIFHCICAYLCGMDETYDICALYDSSLQNLALMKACLTPPERISHTTEQVKDDILIKVKIRVDLFIASAKAVPLLPVDSSTLLQEIQSLIHTLIQAEFGDLPTDIASEMLTEIEEFHSVTESPTYEPPSKTA